MVFCCGCGFRTSGDVYDLLGHVRGKHYVEVRLGNCHYAHCNEDGCLRQNGHGRRLNSFESLQDHLIERHGIDIWEED